MTSPRDQSADDLVLQKTLLDQVFGEAGLRLPKVRLTELTPPPEFASRDAVDRAVRDLVRAGLLHADGDALEPTDAASMLRELNAIRRSEERRPLA